MAESCAGVGRVCDDLCASQVGGRERNRAELWGAGWGELRCLLVGCSATNLGKEVEGLEWEVAFQD